MGDLKEFARRTKEARAAESTTSGGTTAELIEADHGPSCREPRRAQPHHGRGRFSFLAYLAARAGDGSWGGSPEADPGVAVVGVWFAEDAVAAAQTLRNIGARPRPVPGSGGSAGGDADADTAESEAFTAKNGGVLMVGAGTGAGSAGLGFEYAGDLGALRQRLEEAGHEAAVVEEATSHRYVANPDRAATAAR